MAGNSSMSVVTLEDLNDDETDKRTSAIVYLSVVMALGIPGNLLVIAVYFGTLKRRQGTHWIFIRALALTDLLVCTIAIPFELFQQTHQLTFYSEFGCKFFRAVSVHLSMTSSLLLIAMSGNRLRRVCQPLKHQLTQQQALVCIAVVVAIGILFCWPEAVISGISLEHIDKYNLTGYDCSFSDRLSGKEYTTIYSTLLLAMYISCMIALVIMYAIVGRQVLKRAKVLNSHRQSCKINPSQTGTEETSCGHHSDDTIDDKSSNEKSVSVAIVKLSDVATKDESKKPKGKCKKCKPGTEKNASKKVTRIAFAISFCFILSYLPYVAVKLNASVVKGRFVSTPLTKAIFPILARTFIINNIINPIIYGFLDPTFLQHCEMTLRLMFCMKLKDFGVQK